MGNDSYEAVVNRVERQCISHKSRTDERHMIGIPVKGCCEPFKQFLRNLQLTVVEEEDEGGPRCRSHERGPKQFGARPRFSKDASTSLRTPFILPSQTDLAGTFTKAEVVPVLSMRINCFATRLCVAVS